jgi:hypothetical protein
MVVLDYENVNTLPPPTEFGDDDRPSGTLWLHLGEFNSRGATPPNILQLLCLVSDSWTRYKDGPAAMVEEPWYVVLNYDLSPNTVLDVRERAVDDVRYLYPRPVKLIEALPHPDIPWAAQERVRQVRLKHSAYLRSEQTPGSVYLHVRAITDSFPSQETRVSLDETLEALSRPASAVELLHERIRPFHPSVVLALTERLRYYTYPQRDDGVRFDLWNQYDERLRRNE